MGKEKTPMSYNDLILKCRDYYNIPININDLKRLIGKLQLLGYLDRVDEEFEIKFHLTQKGRKLFENMLKDEEKPKS